MATYVTLLTYTAKGIDRIREAPARLADAKRMYKTVGGVIKGFYSIMGRYDAVVISEAPDDETAAKIALAVGALGNVKTETFRAFEEDEYKKIISGLP